eukprot:scaffold157057_cov40-Cyclotella_meneghiniana.AAC.1
MRVLADSIKDGTYEAASRPAASRKPQADSQSTHEILLLLGTPPLPLPQSNQFTKASHKRLLILQQERNNDNEQQQEEEAAAIGIVKAASSIDTKRNNTEGKKHEREATMDQCIALLEPHLTAFRERCDAASKLKLRKSEHSGTNDDSEDTSSLYEDDE